MSTKDHILSYLKERKGNWVSGESISGKVAVSRTAIWKHIHKLKEEGYDIASAPKKGYLFHQAPDLLLPHEIREDLDTRFLGKGEIDYQREIDSTNARAKDLAAKDAPEGTLVLSEAQKKGRGRRGRYWFSPPGEGIYVSLILRPDISPIEVPKITLLAAVAMAEPLFHLTPLDIRIKWPNDILVKGRKLAGILTELSADTEVTNFVVVGLGLNVNMPRFPPELERVATSVFMETGTYYSRITLLREYLRQFERHYDILLTAGFGPVLKRWRELADIIGRRILVEMINDRCIGTVKEIDDHGVLILEDEKGGSRRILSGDLSFL